MNYLAHSCLCFTDEQLVGQFLEEVIANRDRKKYSDKIQQGIILHREIDTFTDAHPVIHEAKKVFSPLVRLYAGAFVDVAMDYFLANSFSEMNLQQHSQKVYKTLQASRQILPERLVIMVDHMSSGNWLYHYREDFGIRNAMQNVLNKARYLEKDIPVFQTFIDNKKVIGEYFDKFYPELYSFVAQVNKRFV